MNLVLEINKSLLNLDILIQIFSYIKFKFLGIALLLNTVF